MLLEIGGEVVTENMAELFYSCIERRTFILSNELGYFAEEVSKQMLKVRLGVFLLFIVK